MKKLTKEEYIKKFTEYFKDKPIELNRLSNYFELHERVFKHVTQDGIPLSVCEDAMKQAGIKVNG